MSTLREGDEVLFKGTVLKIGIHGTEVQVQFGDGERFKTSVGWIPAHCAAEAALRAETPRDAALQEVRLMLEQQRKECLEAEKHTPLNAIRADELATALINLRTL